MKRTAHIRRLAALVVLFGCVWHPLRVSAVTPTQASSTSVSSGQSSAASTTSLSTSTTSGGSGSTSATTQSGTSASSTATDSTTTGTPITTGASTGSSASTSTTGNTNTTIAPSGSTRAPVTSPPNVNVTVTITALPTGNVIVPIVTSSSINTSSTSSNADNTTFVNETDTTPLTTTSMTTTPEPEVCLRGNCTGNSSGDCLQNITTTCELENGKYCYQLHQHWSNGTKTSHYYEVDCRAECEHLTETSGQAPDPILTSRTNCCQEKKCNREFLNDPNSGAAVPSLKFATSAVAMATAGLLLLIQAIL